MSEDGIGIYTMYFGPYFRIGQTSDFKQRKKRHLREIENITTTKKIYNAYTLYGLPRFEFQPCKLGNLDLFEWCLIYLNIDNPYCLNHIRELNMYIPEEFQLPDHLFDLQPGETECY